MNAFFFVQNLISFGKFCKIDIRRRSKNVRAFERKAKVGLRMKYSLRCGRNLFPACALKGF